MNAQNLLRLIKNRRTTRVDFLPRPILKGDIRYLLDAAQWAPSGHNLQPWEFIVVQKDEIKKKIAHSTILVIEELLQDNYKLKRTFGSYFKLFYNNKKDALAKGYGLYGNETPPYLEKRITPKVVNQLRSAGKKYCQRLENTPLLLITLLNRQRTPPNISSGLIMMISIGAALQNIRLAATAKGIGCQDAARPIDTVEGKRRIKEILDIPKEYDMVSVMRLGYVNPKIENMYYSKFRVKPNDIIHFDTF